MSHTDEEVVSHEKKLRLHTLKKISLPVGSMKEWKNCKLEIDLVHANMSIDAVSVGTNQN